MLAKKKEENQKSEKPRKGINPFAVEEIKPPGAPLSGNLLTAMEESERLKAEKGELEATRNHFWKQNSIRSLFPALAEEANARKRKHPKATDPKDTENASAEKNVKKARTLDEMFGFKPKMLKLAKKDDEEEGERERDTPSNQASERNDDEEEPEVMEA